MHKILEETLGPELFEPGQLSKLHCDERETDTLRLQCGWKAQLLEKEVGSATDLKHIEMLYEVQVALLSVCFMLTISVLAHGTAAFEFHSE